MKSNRGKLLSTVAVLMLAICAFAIVMPTTDAAPNDITYVSGTIDKDMTFTDGNKVVVDKDLKVINGASLIIGDGAQFTVNEGVTLTIDGAESESGKKAAFATTTFADVNINGALIVGENGTLSIKNGENQQEEGFVPGFDVVGTLTFQNGSESNDINGKITVGSAGSVSVTSIGTKISKISGATIALMPGATFTLRGQADVTVETVTGNKDPANIVSASAVISHIDTGATVTNAKVSNLTFTASAESVTAYKDDEGKISKYQVDVTKLDVSGTIQNGDSVTVSSEETQYSADRNKIDKKTTVSSQIVISQTLNVAKTGSITVGADTLVSGTVVVTTNDDKTDSISLTGDAKITVTGSVTFSAEAFTEANGNGALKVQGGTVTIKDCDDPTALKIGDLYGAYYTVPESNTTYIVDLKVAIDAAAADATVNEVHVYGGKYSESDPKNYKNGYVVTESFEVPANVTLVVSNALVIPEDVTVTVPENAFVDVASGLAPGVIVVDGKVIDSSLTLALKGDKPSGVVCEVTITTNDGATVTYTSLAIAIADSQAGDVIELAGDAVVEGQLTIPADRTVVVGDFTLTVTNDSELIVDGVLVAINENSVITAEKTDEKKAGVVTVNNLMVVDIDDAFSEADYNISGVYADADNVSTYGSHLVMSIGVFAQNSAACENAEIFGTVSSEDITLTSGEDRGKTLTVNGKFTAGTVTIDGYTFVVSENGEFSGTVATAEGSVEFQNVKGTVNANITVADTQVVDEDDRMVITGTPATVYVDGKAQKATMTVDGTVYIGNMDLKALESLTAPEGTTVNVTGTVSGVKILTVAGEMKITGSITGVTFLNVTGSITVDKKGILGAEVAYVGLTKNDVDNGAATSQTSAAINGTVTLDTVYAAPGSTLPESYADIASTQFLVGETLWMTAYGTGYIAEVKKAPVQNGIFNNWVNADGDEPKYDAQSDEGTEFGAQEFEKVYADADYEIYTVTIVADNGIGSVMLNGNVLTKVSNIFEATDLTAGSYTVSYTLKAGYEGQVTMKVNGQSVSGYSFTLSGTENTDVEITLSGTTPAASEPVVIEDKDSGMGITDYLLIILVILVIVMAVIVAMRLMRS